MTYHVKQFDGGSTACDGRNCAAASCAMAIYYGSGGKIRLTSDMVRTQSGVSCVPGTHSGSGGLFISDVERVCARNGVSIDYGAPTRWPAGELERRLDSGHGAVILGDYDALYPRTLRASTTFLGDHSVFVHQKRLVSGQVQVHWHDPLQPQAMWVALSSVIGYWQKPGSVVMGFAGFVMDRATKQESDMAVVYATPGRNRVQVKADTPYFRQPGDTVPAATIRNAATWFDEIVYAAKADGTVDTSWIGIDGLSPTAGTAPVALGWIRNTSIARREPIPAGEPLPLSIVIGNTTYRR